MEERGTPFFARKRFQVKGCLRAFFLEGAHRNGAPV